MDELPPPSPSAEYARLAVYDLVKALGQAGLLAPPTIDRLMHTNPEMFDLVVERFTEHAQHLGALIAAEQGDLPEPRPGESPEEDPEMPMNTHSRRLISSLIGLQTTDKDFWKALGLSQGQARAFGAEAIEDYRRFRTYRRGSELHLASIRLYMDGIPDSVAKEQLGAVSDKSLRIFRSRFSSMLHDHYTAGIHTSRRKLAAYLNPDQLAVLKARFPESFVETGEEN